MATSVACVAAVLTGEQTCESNVKPWLQLTDAAASPSSFSLALAGLVELDCTSQQQLLESTSTAERLHDLLRHVETTRSFYAARAALRRLGGTLG